MESRTTLARDTGFAFALLLLTCLAYLPAWNAGFIWDDDQHVLFDEELRGAAGLLRLWFEPGASQQFYPVTYTTFWIEHYLWGLHPRGYHVVNVLLHALNSVLLWRLLRRHGLKAGWLAAALFALHPVHAESVTWISERKNVLSGLFYLLSATMFFRAAPPDSEEAKPRAGGLVASLGCFVGALLSKSVTATLPAALLLVMWWKRGRIARRDLLLVAPYFAIGIAFALLTVYVEHHFVGAKGEAFELTFAQRVLIAGRAIWFYAWKLIWPAELIFFYPKWTIDAAELTAWLFPGAFVAVVATLFALRNRIGRGPLMAVLYFAGTLGPALGFINFYPMRFSYVADHFQYLASIGVLALVAESAWRAERMRNFLLPVIPVVLFVLAGLTWGETLKYRDSRSLYGSVIRDNPGAYVAHYNLGEVLRRSNELAEAMKHLQEAHRLFPDHPGIALSIGEIHARFGDDRRAMEWYQKAVQVRPDYAPGYYNIGNVHARAGDLDEAERYWRLALQHDPGHKNSIERLDYLEQYRKNRRLPTNSGGDSNEATSSVQPPEFQ